MQPLLEQLCAQTVQNKAENPNVQVHEGRRGSQTVVASATTHQNNQSVNALQMSTGRITVIINKTKGQQWQQHQQQQRCGTQSLYNHQVLVRCSRNS